MSSRTIYTVHANGKAVYHGINRQMKPVGYINEPPVTASDLTELGRLKQWNFTVERLADLCRAENPAFNRERWFDYIKGECGPSGGAIKASKSKV